MDLHWAEDGALVSTSAGTMMGQPMAQRFVIEFDDAGACKRGVGHTIFGTMAPFESFRATYARKEK